MTTRWTRAAAATELDRLAALVTASFPDRLGVAEQLSQLADGARLGLADRGLMAAGAHHAAGALPDSEQRTALRDFARDLDA